MHLFTKEFTKIIAELNSMRNESIKEF